MVIHAFHRRKLAAVEMTLKAFGVTEGNWRDANEKVPHFPETVPKH